MVEREIVVTRLTGRANLWHMVARKSDAERGPVGAWAYGVRGSFKDEHGKPNLWPEEVAPLMESQPHPATIRKIESDPNYHPDDMVQDLFRVYRRLGDQRGVHVPQPPVSETASAPGDLAEAIRQQAAAIQALADAQMSSTDLAELIGDAIRLAVREALQAVARDAASQRQ